jgi:hypothetical protein
MGPEHEVVKHLGDVPRADWSGIVHRAQQLEMRLHPVEDRSIAAHDDRCSTRAEHRRLATDAGIENSDAASRCLLSDRARRIRMNRAVQEQRLPRVHRREHAARTRDTVEHLGISPHHDIDDLRSARNLFSRGAGLRAQQPRTLHGFFGDVEHQGLLTRRDEMLGDDRSHSAHAYDPDCRHCFHLHGPDSFARIASFRPGSDTVVDDSPGALGRPLRA